MPGIDSPLVQHKDNDSGSSAYNLLLLLSGLAIAAYLFIRYAESRNRLNYKNRSARIVSGVLQVMTDVLHTTKGNLMITGHEGQIITVGPHRTGLVDGAVIVSKMVGTAPHAFATDVYNFIPGVRYFMSMFNVITIKAQATKGSDGRSANAEALEKAGQVLKDKGCIALVPQGNFSFIGKEPPRVYEGAAKLALGNGAAIRVIRLDGFWSINNSYIPLFIRNNSYYRALGSYFHMNNVRVTECCVIDFHLKPESKDLSEAEKIKEICSQLYAFYHNAGDLTRQQIRSIQSNIIKEKVHHLIWSKKIEHDKLAKDLVTLDTERTVVEKAALTS